MKNSIYLLLLIFLFAACEEDVILELDTIEKKLIIDARLTNEQPAAIVRLTYSQAFYDIPDIEAETGANVEISDSNNNSWVLAHDSAGIYYSIGFEPVFNEKYTLHVNTLQHSVEVTTQLPEQVAINSVNFVPNPFFSSPDSLNAFVNVADPIGVDNFFRLFIHNINSERTNEFYLVDDNLGRDKIITMPVYYRIFAPQDTVLIELWHLNRETFIYHSGLSENIRGSFNSIAPGNPPSNMPDDIYGVFASYSVTRDTIIVPPLFGF